MSPHHQDVVLLNWAKAARRNIGRKGYAGWSLHLGVDSVGTYFAVQHLGPGFSPFKQLYRFDPGERQKYKAAHRKWAFRSALELYDKLTNFSRPT